MLLRSPLPMGAIPTASLIALSYLSTTAAAYDLGCQYVWETPSANNDLLKCIEKIPSDNGGVLVPPIIPLILFVFLLILFPIMFFGRCCCNCFGSDKIRPGAGCCCDGEEWDEIPTEEKVTVYPSRHVLCIKLLCVAVTLMCVFSVVAMPIGSQMVITYVNDFFDSADRDVLTWADNLKNDLKNDLRLANNSFPAPITEDTFSSLDEFIEDARKYLKDGDDMMDQYVKTVGNVISYVAFIPLVLCAFMILLFLFSIRRIVPSLCMWVYYVVGLAFSLLSIFMMIVGVMLVLLDGEMELNTWKAPGLMQWYGVPMCEEKAMFSNMKSGFYHADKEKGIELCREFMEFCDDLAFAVVEVPGVSSQKPFQCNLNNANVEATCPSVTIAGDLVSSMESKPGAPVCTSQCTVEECADQCVDQDAKDHAVQIRDNLAIGKKILAAIDRAFVYCDCDVLITQVLKTLKGADKGAQGAFLAAAGTGFGALFLMWGIILLCKGQKLFFKKRGAARVSDYGEDGGQRGEQYSMKPLD